MVYSLISLSDLSLLVYRNARNFSALILYPSTSLNSLMSSSNFFLVASLGFSMHSIMPSETVTALLLLFQFGFISFSSLIALARTFC